MNSIRHIIQRLQNPGTSERGAVLLWTLASLAMLFIPMVMLLRGTAFLTTASGHASGIAYNTSYSALQRAINTQATSNAPAVQLYQLGDAEYANVVADVSRIQDLAERAIRRSQAFSNINLSLVGPGGQPNWGNDALFGGGSPPVAFVNMGVDPEHGRCLADAQCQQGQAPLSSGVRPRCQPSAGARAMYVSGQMACWKDERGMLAANAARYQQAYSHYSSGTQAIVRFQVNNLFPLYSINNATGLRYGVSTVGRPCDENRLQCAQ